MDVPLAPGRLVVVVGPNGAGKTSLLRHLAELPAARRLPVAPMAVAYVPEVARDGLVGLTVRGEYRLRGLPAGPIEGRGDQESATLSAGEARRVVIDGALRRPGLLALDEPLADLDETAQEDMARRIRHRGGVIASDHTGRLLPMADHVIRLGPTTDPPLARPPHRTGPPVLVADATYKHIHLPAVAFGPGFHVVHGANGTGKTSLLRRLAGLDGEGVTLHGRPLVIGDAAFAQEDAHRWILEPRVDAVTTAFSAIADRHPATLSRGEVQRVALAKALRGKVILLDEPEVHLDGEGRAWLMQEIASRVADDAVVVAATHDPGLRALAQTRVRL